MDFEAENETKKKKAKLVLIVHGDERPRNEFLDRLPHDIVLDILSRLPITSLIKFSFVCRSWHLLTRDPLLVHSHLSVAERSNPCLVFHYDYPIRNQLLFVDLSDDGERMVRKIYSPFCSSMPEFSVVGSCNGILCLSNSYYNDSLYIFNPFTMKYRELPKSRQFQEQQVFFGFGCNPDTNEYKVVKIVYYRNASSFTRNRIRSLVYPLSEVLVFTLGNDDSWRCVGKAPYQFDRRLRDSVFVNGRIHWTSKCSRYHGAVGRKIVSFDLRDEEFKEVLKPDEGTLKRHNYDLAVLRGCLSAVVHMGHGKLEIWVMKQYDVKESWVKECSVGAYSPKVSSRGWFDSGVWKRASYGRKVRVVCALNGGEVLLEYRWGTLISYNPEKKEFKSVLFPGMPNTPMYRTFMHLSRTLLLDLPVSLSAPS